MVEGDLHCDMVSIVGFTVVSFGVKAKTPASQARRWTLGSTMATHRTQMNIIPQPRLEGVDDRLSEPHDQNTLDIGHKCWIPRGIADNGEPAIQRICT